jgi:hypothetical protein
MRDSMRVMRDLRVPVVVVDLEVPAHGHGLLTRCHKSSDFEGVSPARVVRLGVSSIATPETYRWT